MLLRRNQDLFNTIKALAGVNDFTSNEISDLVSFTNRRLNMAYNASPMWERYVQVSEKRNLIALNLGNFTSTVSTDLLFNGNYKVYEFTQVQSGSATFGDGKLSNTIYQSVDSPTRFIYRVYAGLTSSDTTWRWEIGVPTFDTNTRAENTVTLNSTTQRATPVEGFATRAEPWDVPLYSTNEDGETEIIITETPNTIPYKQTGRETIQEFIRVHRTSAFNKQSATEYDFYVTRFGAAIIGSTTSGEEAFVTYKLPIVNLTTGQIITSLDTTATSNYLTEIPLEFFNYTAHAVYADFLRMDGQHDKAAFEEDKAELSIASELERIDIISNNNSLNHKFSTYVNTSSR